MALCFNRGLFTWVVILYSARSIPLALAMDGGRGPVVGMCGLFLSLLMDCGRLARWMDGISRSVASSSPSPALACVCGA